MDKETGGAAYPSRQVLGKNPIGADVIKDHAGMTLRDYFAAHAPAVPDWFKHEPTSPMPHIVAGNETMREHVESKMIYNAWVNEQKAFKFFAWRTFYADAMLAERAK
jgi:hypothetical protein